MDVIKKPRYTTSADESARGVIPTKKYQKVCLQA